MHERRPDEAPRGVLAGVRVADFSRVLAGPYATMMLADFGADVVKIEPPTGDDTRHWTPPVDATGQATYFGSVNRNKRSVALDLTDAAGRAEAQRLAATADVVIENFRPGVMARFGLSFEDVHACEPRRRLLLDHGVRHGRWCRARRLRPARAGRRRAHVDHRRARRRAGEGRRRARRRAHRPERVRRHPARPARARQYRPWAARRGEPRAEPALGADQPGGVDARHRRRAPAARQRAPQHRARTRCSTQAIANSSSRSATTSSSGRSRACSGGSRYASSFVGRYSITGRVRDERRPGRAPRRAHRAHRAAPRRGIRQPLGRRAHGGRRSRRTRERRRTRRSRSPRASGSSRSPRSRPPRTRAAPSRTPSD